MLKGNLQQNEHIYFTEPDLEFMLSPAKQDYEGSTVDIKVKMFEYGKLPAGYYNICLEEEGIIQLLSYLNKIMPTIKLEKNEKIRNILIMLII